MSYIIPGKTFLVGEYSALVGGSVLGLSTGPGFQVSSKNENQAVQEFSLNSPAGYLLQDNAEHFKNLKISIDDGFSPYGGFGKSTAEYLSVAVQLMTQKKSEMFEQMRTTYRDYSQKSGAEVSGLDLAIQYFGHVTYFNSRNNTYSATPWAYPEYDFILLSTGQKVKTHEHIQKLSPSHLSALLPVSDQAIDGYFSNDVHEFIRGLKIWSETLEQAGFLSSATKDIKVLLEKNKYISCVKPCGAMGADVILVLCEQTQSTQIQKEIKEMNLMVHATSKDLFPGVQSVINDTATADIQGSYVG